MFIKTKTIKIFFLAFLLCLLPLPTKAQEITTDGTTATSVNSPDGSNFDIDGGDKAGGNLFHSFGNFGVPTGGSANFLNSPDVVNIINRVTGGNVSNIDGLIKAAGSANLFLINPAGIIFGQNARLDIGGSFLGSTADSLRFSDGTEFSATNVSKPILTINAPIGLNLRDNPSAIDNQANDFGLEVDPGKNIALIGGDVSLNGGLIIAPGGRVELGGLTAAGEIGLNDDGSLSFPDAVARGNVSLTNSAFVDVTGEGGGFINVKANNLEILEGSSLIAGIREGFGFSGAQAGDITIDAKDTVRIVGDTNSSRASGITNRVGTNGQSIGNAGDVLIKTKIFEGNGGFAIGSATFGRGDAGKVTIEATDKIFFDGGGANSGIASIVTQSAIGNADDIIITTPFLSLSNAAQIATSTAGQGNASNIQINATDSISISGDSILQAASFSSGNAGKITINAENANISFDAANLTTETNGTGQGGDISVKGRSLSLSNGAKLSTDPGFSLSSNPENAGNIDISVTENISLSDGSQFTSQSFSKANAGNLNLSANSVFLNSRATLSTASFRSSNAGNINIDAKDTVFTDNSSIISAYSDLLGNKDIIGKSGDINIQGNSLTFTNKSLIGSSTLGRGNAGNVQLKADRSISIAGGTTLQALTAGAGNAGNINIDAENADVAIDGKGTAVSAAVGSTEFQGFKFVATGKGGNIKVNSRSLSLSNGAGLLNATATQAGEPGLTDAGDIDIKTGKLSLTDGGYVNASTIGRGNAGKITIQATDIFADGVADFKSGVFSTVEQEGIGSSDGIDITTSSLTLKNGAQVNASTLGQGNAGNLTINADNISIDGVGTNDFSSGIFSTVEGQALGNGGNVAITTKNLSLTNGGQVITSTFAQGNAGKITIQATDIFADGGGIEGFLSGIFSAVNTQGKGNAGGIEITTEKLSLSNSGLISSSTLGQGSAGNVNINANSINLDKGSILAVNNPSIPIESNNNQLNTGGNINLNIKDRLFMRNGSKISAQAFGNASGGNIDINAADGFVVAFPNQDNDILASSVTGQAGKITISAERVFGFEKPRRNLNPDEINQLLENGTNDLNASSGTSGLEGTVSIESPDVNPTQGIEESPENVVEPDETVAQACSGDGNIAQGNSFTITGRGGLPPSPTEPLNSSFIQGAEIQGGPDAQKQGSRGAEMQGSGGTQNISLDENKKTFSSDEVIPARGMTVNAKGQIVLTAYPTPNTTTRPASDRSYCHNNASTQNHRTSYSLPSNYLVEAENS
jgi:filamentous hemagglutinin family protein